MTKAASKPEGDISEFLAEQTGPRKVVGCTIGLTLEELDEKAPARAADLRKALDPKSGVQHSTIERILRKWGYKTTEGTIGRHRRDQCRCGEHGLGA